MKNIISIFVLFILSNICVSQNSIIATSKPKLVVGIVVDQMRYDYLTRFENRYGEGGFKRMMNEGFNCKNNHLNYVPAYTAPGHASIFTGTTPKYHGIIANNWFDKASKRHIYCVRDNTYQSVGTKSNSGKVSPERLLTTTIGDQNKVHTQMRGKSIGISIKDRSAVLSAGHTANAAYWFQAKDEGNWITSSYYMEELPKWVKKFNKKKSVASYFKVWNTLYDIDTYTESGDDLNDFEGGFNGKETATFPYDLAALKEQNNGFDIITESAYGNNMTTDFAIAALDGEQLGQDNITDILSVSYSSTDKVGHNFGVNSKEVEDIYLRLDKDLERLFNALDAKVGKGNYTVFLTADHGAPNVPAFLKSVKIPGGLFDLNKMKDEMNHMLEQRYKYSNLILSSINNHIYLDHDKINQGNLDLQKLKNVIANELLKYKLIDKVYITSEVNQLEEQYGYFESFLNHGFHQKRSGDIVLVFTPGVIKDVVWNRTGTAHSTSFNYDSHVPLLFFGKGINHGSTITKTRIVDIVPTISALLDISFPNGAIGDPLQFVLKQD